MKGAKVLAGLKGAAATGPALIREPANGLHVRPVWAAGGRKEPHLNRCGSGAPLLVPRSALSVCISLLDLFLDILVTFSLQSA